MDKRDTPASAAPKPARQRREGFIKPVHWRNDPPPAPSKAAPAPSADPDGLSPTRYGDWVRKGIAVDF